MSTLAALKVSVLDYIWEKLSMGYYVLCDFDEYYVRGKKSYMKMHFIHDTLILKSNYSTTTILFFLIVITPKRFFKIFIHDIYMK